MIILFQIWCNYKKTKSSYTSLQTKLKKDGVKTVSIQEIKNELGAHLTDEKAQEIVNTLAKATLLTAKIISYEQERAI